MGVLIPEAKDDFHVSNTMAAFLPLFFFIAYGVMSIPAGLLTEKYKEKKVMILAFSLACIGSLIFAFFPRYGIMLGSLFLIGIGMAILQVAINPSASCSRWRRTLRLQFSDGSTLFWRCIIFKPDALLLPCKRTWRGRHAEYIY